MTAGGGSFNGGGLSAAASKIASTASGNYEVVLYQKVSVGTGAQANNPWLQELPDPISKVTWDNYAMISPAMARALFSLDVSNQKQADDYEVHPEKPVIKITVGGKNIPAAGNDHPGIKYIYYCDRGRLWPGMRRYE